MSKNLKEYVVIIFTAIVLTLLINKFLLFKIVIKYFIIFANFDSFMQGVKRDEQNF